MNSYRMVVIRAVAVSMMTFRIITRPPNMDNVLNSTTLLNYTEDYCFIFIIEGTSVKM